LEIAGRETAERNHPAGAGPATPAVPFADVTRRIAASRLATSIGLVKCPEKPADRLARRSSSEPYPLLATCNALGRRLIAFSVIDEPPVGQGSGA
jgi:hypothetical protein